MKKTILLYIILFTTVFWNYSYAQVKVNVITKTVTKEFDYSNETLIIHGEKSNINIQKWNSDKLKVQINFIAKNTSKSKAEKDIEVMKYSVNQTKEAIKLSNYFKSDKIIDISSNLSIQYKIYTPSECSVEIKNLYGKTEVTDVLIYGKIDNSFGSVSLQNVSGNLDVSLYYSGFFSDNTQGKLRINARNSDLSMKSLSGENHINTLYGEINIVSIQELNLLRISAQRTSVNVTTDNFEKYNYELSTQKNEIVVPQKYTESIIQDSRTVSFKQTFSTDHKSIIIQTSYCPIIINSK